MPHSAEPQHLRAGTRASQGKPWKAGVRGRTECCPGSHMAVFFKKEGMVNCVLCANRVDQNKDVKVVLGFGTAILWSDAERG